MPLTPSSVSAFRTSSSLNGLMIAITSFIDGRPLIVPSADVFAPTLFAQPTALGKRKYVQKLCQTPHFTAKGIAQSSVAVKSGRAMLAIGEIDEECSLYVCSRAGIC